MNKVGVSRQQYERLLAQADKDGVEVKWHRNYTYYVGTKKQRNNNRVDYRKSGFVCDCETFKSGTYCVHAAVARRAVIEESNAVAEQQAAEYAPAPQPRKDDGPVFWTNYLRKFNS